MGSKHALSNGNEPEEMTDLIAAFEAQNKCKIILSCCLELHGGYQDLRWSATVLEVSGGESGPQNLGCGSVKIWGGEYRTLMAVVTRLLYALDFQLALDEFDKVAPKKA